MALDTVILERLAKDPVARPASAIELDRRLAAIVFDEAWTSEAAQRWWELHLPAPNGMNAEASPAPHHAGTREWRRTGSWATSP